MSMHAYAGVSVCQHVCECIRACRKVRVWSKPSEGPLSPGRAVYRSTTLSLLVVKFRHLAKAALRLSCPPLPTFLSPRAYFLCGYTSVCKWQTKGRSPCKESCSLITQDPETAASRCLRRALVAGHCALRPCGAY